MIKKLRHFFELSGNIFGQYKIQIFILIALGFIGGFAEAIGINALIPLLSFALGTADREMDTISKMIKSFFDYFSIEFTVAYILIFIVSLFFIKTIIMVFSHYIKVRITSDYEERTRRDLFETILNANWPYLIKQKLGHLETVLMLDVPASTSLLNQTSTAIMLLTSLIIYILVAINISAPVTLITLALGIIIFLILKPFIRYTRMLGYQKININKSTAHTINENILGIKTVKIMNVGDKIAEKGRFYFREMRNIYIKLSLLNSMPIPFIQFIGIVYICAVFAFAYKSAYFSIAAIPSIIYLIYKIFSYLEQLQSGLSTFNGIIPSLKSVLKQKDSAFAFKEPNAGVSKFKFNNELRFENVFFSYIPQKEILKGINFSIHKGEFIGLIGPSGAGKTTIVDLILRLLVPIKGTIAIDGIDINSIDIAEWRRNIGYVSQDIFLMNDTVANNIRFYDESLNDSDIETAAKMANIYEFVKELPEGFDTIIGERGLHLSAGQRQRIVIARILARKPELLILDEATSALDNESEAKIQQVIKNLKGKVTVLVIAHRLSTVLDCDRLLALDDGMITEEGVPQILLENKDSYFFKTFNIRK